MNLKDKTVLVTCSSLFVSLAERLGRDFKKVLLYTPHYANFPELPRGMAGDGLENVEKVDHVFGPHFEEVSLFVFCDLGHAALQVQLELMGKRVWGARYGEELEIYREVCKREMEARGLPVQPWKIVEGVTALRRHLEATKDQHVKINRWRGLTESFFAPNAAHVAPKLDALAHDLGAYRERMEFIVEDDLPDRVEIGLDTFTVDGEWPKETLVGIEAKDVGYCGQVRPWAKIPEPLRRWNERMSDVFAKAGSRTTVSNEVRIGKDKLPFMIDATIRMPSPPGELIQELTTNLSEILWHGAGGVMVHPEFAGTWGVEVLLRSSWANAHHLQVKIPDKFRRFVKLYNHVREEGEDYVMCQSEDMQEFGAVVGFGDSLDAAVEMAKEVGEAVDAYGLKFSLGPVDQVREQIAKIEEIGVSPFAE